MNAIIKTNPAIFAVVVYLFVVSLSTISSLSVNEFPNAKLIDENISAATNLKSIVEKIDSSELVIPTALPNTNEYSSTQTDNLQKTINESNYFTHFVSDNVDLASTTIATLSEINFNAFSNDDSKSSVSAPSNIFKNKSDFLSENSAVKVYNNFNDGKSNLAATLVPLKKNATSFNSSVMKVYPKKDKDMKGRFKQNEETLVTTTSTSPRSLLKTDADVFLPLYLSHLDDAIESMEGNLCKEHSRHVLKGIRTREQWAMQMYDASAKMPQGVLWGSTYQMGNYDECLKVELSNDDLYEPRIRGQYCMATIALNMTQITKKYGVDLESLIYSTKNKDRNYENRSLHWGVCVPSSCSSKDIEKLVGYVVSASSASSAPLNVQISPNMCSSQKEKQFKDLDFVYACVIASFILIVLLCTIFHLVCIYSDNPKENKSVVNEVIVSFSIVQNLQKILGDSDNSNDMGLDCIGGIRFIAMVFIISGHSLLFTVSAPVMNDGFWKQMITQVENAFLLNNPLLVDTFLLMSGFLMCLLLLIELEKRKGRLNFLFVYIGRYIRLTPSYAVVIGFYTTWMVHINDGPLWNSRMLVEQERCLTSWWVNLLYINNYVSVDNLCMFQSWYLSVDTQLFFLAPLIIYPLWKWPKIGQVLLAVITTISIVVPFVITYLDNLDASLLVYAPEIKDLALNSYFINVYIKMHMRATAYCFGLVLGFIVYKIQLTKFKIPRPVVWWCSLIGIIIGILSMYTLSVFYQNNYAPNTLSNASYNAFHRVGWCLAIGWLIIACVTNNAGPLNKLLCWKFFQPFSRLTYCAYLTNGLVVLYSAAVVRSPQYMSVYSLFCQTTSHIIISFGLALILCLIFESPIHGLEKILLRKGKQKKPIVEVNLPEA